MKVVTKALNRNLKFDDLVVGRVYVDVNDSKSGHYMLFGTGFNTTEVQGLLDLDTGTTYTRVPRGWIDATEFVEVEAELHVGD